MPETAVDKDGEVLAGKNEVGFAGQRAPTLPAGDAVGTIEGSQTKLGGAVAVRADGCWSNPMSAPSDSVVGMPAVVTYDQNAHGVARAAKQEMVRESAQVCPTQFPFLQKSHGSNRNPVRGRINAGFRGIPS